MKINAITSATNPLLKKIRSLHDRRGREKTGLFLIEGRKAVGEAFDKGIAVEEIVASQTYWKQNADLPEAASATTVSVVDDKLFQELVTTVTPEGILAVAKIPSYSIADMFKDKKAPLVVVAVAVQDPGNVGTIIRAALAACSSGVVLTKGSVDPFNPKVVRSAMGALFALPVISDIEFDQVVAELKSRKIKLLACQQGSSKRYFDCDLTQPLAIVLGNEAQGLSDAEMAQADELIAIPMNEASESLNVAVSGSIVLFSAVEQRIKAGIGHGTC